LSHPYDRLTPDLILDAVATTGLEPDGHLLALNSYENRVFQIGIEDQPPVVAKFYRPGRWSNETIQEEHDFARDLAAEELPVVAPWRNPDQASLFEHAGFRFGVFERRGGRAPEPGDLDQLEWIGRFIGRIHLAGQARVFDHRPRLGSETFGRPARAAVLDSPLLPVELQSRYDVISGQLLDAVDAVFTEVRKPPIRLHGDCHHGNILWTDAGPHFVDLDDCRSGPSAQDLWMLLNGDRNEQMMQLDALLEGYTVFRDFDAAELRLIEPLRSLRLIHYTGWIAQRWDDPAFPNAFPWFDSTHYWTQHVIDLQQQLDALDEPPLRRFA
jgi:Ser/Thr protein kinase RdoA (MazF antagonist)